MIRFAWPASDGPLSQNGSHGNKFEVGAARRSAKAEGHWYANTYKPDLPEKGDIHVRITFHPPSRRWDRLNMPSLFKSQFDGIAEGWGVNDRRFHPHFVFGEPKKGGECTFEVLSEGAG